MNNKWIFGKEVLAALEKSGVLATFESHGNAMYRINDTGRATTLLDNGACVGSVSRAVKYLERRILS